jgi:hypothetical protein
MTSWGSFFSFYQKRFLPAYLRMKITLLEGNPLPQPIVDGITGSFTHLSHSCGSGLDPEDQARYISLALDALIETTYLCYEIVVISIGSEISTVCDDPRKARFCINMSYSDFKEEHARFKAAGNEAKKSAEMKSDVSCKAAIRAYEEAITIGESLLGKIDWVKIEDYNQESEQAATLAVIQEESSLNRSKMIELLTNQLSLHPKRSFAAIVLVFIASGFFNAILKNFYDQILFPHAWQYLNDNGINLTAIIQR